MGREKGWSRREEDKKRMRGANANRRREIMKEGKGWKKERNSRSVDKKEKDR